MIIINKIRFTLDWEPIDPHECMNKKCRDQQGAIYKLTTQIIKGYTTETWLCKKCLKEFRAKARLSQKHDKNTFAKNKKNS